MNCQTFEQYLVDYLEGTLSSKDTCDVDAHLQQCVHCQTLLAQEKAISEKLQQWPKLTCPESVIEEVFFEIDARQPHVSWKTSIQWWFAPEHVWKIGVAAAIIVVLVVVKFLYLGGDASQIQQIVYSAEEVEQAKKDIELTLAYVHHYTKKTSNILEHQLASTQTVVRQPVQTILEHQIASTQTAIRRPVETRVKNALTSILDGGTL
jgi:hypothetical protein